MKLKLNAGNVFTIAFRFEEEPAKRLVCMYEKRCKILFKIYVFNEELHSVLPSSKLEFNFTEGLCGPQKLMHKKGEMLVKSSTGRVSQFLPVKEQSRW